MAYNSLNLIDGDVLDSSHIRHIESGLREIEENIESMKVSLINILRDKGITMPDDSTFDELYQEVNKLQRISVPKYDYTTDIVDVTDVESGQIKIVFDDSNNGNAGFVISALGGIEVDWGDGKIEKFIYSNSSANSVTHKYTVGSGQRLDGTRTQYVATVRPIVENNISGFSAHGTAAIKSTMLSIAARDIQYTNSPANTFASCTKLESFYMFGGCIGAAGTNFSMASMFYPCAKLKIVHIDNVAWENCTSLEYTFRSCPMLEEVNISNYEWNTEICTSFYYTFYDCKMLKRAPNINTKSASTLSYAFCNCTSIEKVVGIWDLSSCANLSYCFYSCTSMTEVPRFKNMYNISNMDNSFSYCRQLASLAEDQEDFNTESVINFNMCFYECNSLEEIPAIDFSAATNVYSMFTNCSSLYIVPAAMSFPNLIGAPYTYTDDSSRNGLDNFFMGCTALNTAPTISAPLCLNAYQMFAGCTSLVNVPEINLPEVVRAHLMFNGCTSLINAPRHMTMPKAQNVRSMFNGCISLKNAPEYDVGDSFSFPNAIYAYNIFYGCTSLVNAPKNIVLDKATNVSSMFYNCSSLVNAPETIVAPAAQNCSLLFYACIKMTTPPVRLEFDSALTANGMFQNCVSLLTCPELYLPKATNVNDMFYGDQSLTSTVPYEFPSATNAGSFYRQCRSLVDLQPLKLGGASCNIGYFAYEFSSKLQTAYFPEPMNGGKLTWSDYTISAASGNTFTGFSNAVDFAGSVAYVTNIFDYTYLESAALKNFNGTLSITNKTYLKSVRLVNPLPSIGNITLTGNGLDAEAINQLFTDLPTVTSTRTINVKGNPGALTCNTSIATAKKWVVTTV